jgi:phage anti-repressor protein
MFEIKLINEKVSAKQLHTILDSKKAFSTWIKKKIEDTMLEEGKDFTTFEEESKGGRPSTDYLLTLEAAQHICIMQRSIKSKSLREYLIGLGKKVQDHKLLDTRNAALAFTLLNTFRFSGYQLEAEDLHKNTFKLSYKAKENIHEAFAKYRNELLTINNQELKLQLINAFNLGMVHKPKAKNIRDRIALLDRFQLIRNAVADYLISVGQSTNDALNFADTVKEIAQFTNIEIRIKDEDTLFENKENVAIPNNLKLLS